MVDAALFCQRVSPNRDSVAFDGVSGGSKAVAGMLLACPAMEPKRPNLGSQRSVAATIIVFCVVGWAPPAAAYRPFDGTDAAVADVGEVEIELQPAGLFRENSQTTLIAPFVVYNYGFAERWELVVQGQAETPVTTTGPSSLTNAGVFLKYVLQPGVLQEKSGPSIATEFGPLLPGINDELGVGFSWAGIVTQRWDWGTINYNVETNLTRDHHAELFLDAIIEGPFKWPIRPVAEVFYDNAFGVAQEISGLIGAIWQVRDNLSFDIGLRHALINGRPINELRAGVTFGFPLNLGRPTRPEPTSAMPTTRR